MRPTFYVDLDCRLQSASAPKERPHAFKVGDVVWLIKPYATEYGIVPAPTKLFVSHIAEEDGTMWLLAEGDVPALFHWDNMMVVAPWDTEDLLPCLRAEVRCYELQLVQSEQATVYRIHGKL